jgi:hypothetical protein
MLGCNSSICDRKIWPVEDCGRSCDLQGLQANWHRQGRDYEVLLLRHLRYGEEDLNLNEITQQTKKFLRTGRLFSELRVTFWRRNCVKIEKVNELCGKLQNI